MFHSILIFFLHISFHQVSYSLTRRALTRTHSDLLVFKISKRCLYRVALWGYHTRLGRVRQLSEVLSPFYGDSPRHFYDMKSLSTHSWPARVTQLPIVPLGLSHERCTEPHYFKPVSPSTSLWSENENVLAWSALAHTLAQGGPVESSCFHWGSISV